MPGRSLPKSLLVHIAPRRRPQLSRPSSTSSIVPDFSADPSTDPSWHTKLDHFRRSLIHANNPSQVWTNYVSLLNFSGFDLLPAELHQHVLRRCTPPAWELRATAAHRLQTIKAGSPPHSYEGRFQTIIRNIRATGIEPSLDDYHFILLHFAAVGHATGSIQVYRELIHRGLSPEQKTYGLCLQAMARRFTLPIFKDCRSRLIEQTRKIFTDLMVDMRKRGITFTSANLDLSIRVLKETLDQEGFESLMKWGYGIDLANPDRPPLEYIEAIKAIPNIPSGEFPAPLPFSTDALNSIIDFLGQSGNISRLVQAFEVLTQPLPKANEHFFSSFDDDDDFGVPGDTPSPTPFSPPHAVPNLTTYNLLLRHICRIGHSTLARHYLLQAIKLERGTDNILRSKLWGWTPLKEIVSPQFSMNRTTLTPVIHLGNSDKDLGLLRWLLSKMPYIVRTKERDLKFYMSIRERRLQWDREQELLEQDHPSSVQTGVVKSPLEPLKPPDGPASNPSAEPSSSSTLSNLTSKPLIAPVPVKPFDIDLHISILERNLYDSERIAARLEDIVGRTTQRIKERLGRRVWDGKDIYMADVDRRITLSREAWARSVGFRERRDPGQALVVEPVVLGMASSPRHLPPHLNGERTPFTQSPLPSSRRLFSTTPSGLLSGRHNQSLWQTFWLPHRP